jgi:hypothetical protein
MSNESNVKRIPIQHDGGGQCPSRDYWHVTDDELAVMCGACRALAIKLSGLTTT